jgi:hypothetical protein
LNRFEVDLSTVALGVGREALQTEAGSSEVVRRALVDIARLDA